jgi:hypothetical protein
MRDLRVTGEAQSRRWATKWATQPRTEDDASVRNAPGGAVPLYGL